MAEQNTIFEPVRVDILAPLDEGGAVLSLAELQKLMLEIQTQQLFLLKHMSLCLSKMADVKFTEGEENGL